MVLVVRIGFWGCYRIILKGPEGNSIGALVVRIGFWGFYGIILKGPEGVREER